MLELGAAGERSPAALPSDGLAGPGGHRRWRVVLVLAGFLAAFAGLDWLTLAFREGPGVVAWYPSDGLGLALLLALGARYAPALAVASLISSVLIYRLPQPAEALLLWAVAVPLVYGLTAALLRRDPHFDPHLPTLRDVGLLVVAATVAAAVLAVISTVGSVQSGDLAAEDALISGLHWWSGELVGGLAVAPFLLVHVQPVLRRFIDGLGPVPRLDRPWHAPRAAVLAQVAALIGAILWVIGTPLLAEFRPLYLIALPLIWIALDHGFAGSTRAILATNLGAMLAAWLFRFDVAHLGEVQLLMVSICVVGLLMGRVVTDQQRAEAQTAERARDLEAAVTEQARLLEEARSHARQQQVLGALGRALAETLDLEGILERLHRAIRGLLPDPDSISIWLCEEEGSLLRCALAESGGERTDVSALPPLPLDAPGVGAPSEAVRTRDPVIVDDREQRPWPIGVDVESGAAGAVRSGLYVPMLAEGHAIGVVMVHSPHPGRYGLQDAAMLGVVANTAAMAIQNARLYAQAQAEITERQRAEADVRLLNASLERQVAERTAELTVANDALRLALDDAARASSVKSQFLSRVSHELRTPLNAVLGFAQLLQLDLPEGSQRESVDQILGSGRHLLELINRVLDISQAESGALAISTEPVAAEAVVAEAIALGEPLGSARGVRIRAQVPDASWRVLADRQRLKQVLVALVENATRHGPPDSEVLVSVVERGQERLRFVVQDAGPGIPPEQTARLFAPFERLDPGGTGVEGSGLGLALSRALVEAMGGSMGLEQEPGDGPRFWFEVPRASGSEPPAAGHPARLAVGRPLAPSSALRAATVLCIDDNPASLRLVEGVAAGHMGLGLLPAMTGRLGLELARRHRPDLVLLDVQLPDTDGLTLLLELRADPSTRLIPVVMMSADVMIGHVERALAAGARAYLRKPIDVSQLMSLLGEVLEGSASPSEPDAAAEPGVAAGPGLAVGREAPPRP